MTEQQVRDLLTKRASNSGSVRKWCINNGVLPSHVTEFLNGNRAAPTDMLDALNLERRIVRKRRSA